MQSIRYGFAIGICLPGALRASNLSRTIQKVVIRRDFFFQQQLQMIVRSIDPVFHSGGRRIGVLSEFSASRARLIALGDMIVRNWIRKNYKKLTPMSHKKDEKN